MSTLYRESHCLKTKQRTRAIRLQVIKNSLRHMGWLRLESSDPKSDQATLLFGGEFKKHTPRDNVSRSSPAPWKTGLPSPVHLLIQWQYPLHQRLLEGLWAPLKADMSSGLGERAGEPWAGVRTLSFPDFMSLNRLTCEIKPLPRSWWFNKE